MCVEAHRAVRRRDGAAQIFQGVEAGRLAKRKADFLGQLAGGGAGERMRQTGFRAAFQPRTHRGFERRGGLHVVVGLIDGAAGKHQHAGHEAMGRVAARHQQARLAIVMAHDQEAGGGAGMHLRADRSWGYVFGHTDFLHRGGETWQWVTPCFVPAKPYTGHMLLLTWHGTILRLETSTGRLTHCRLVPRRESGADFTIVLPETARSDSGLEAPLSGPDGMILAPGAEPGAAHLMRDSTYLTVSKTAHPVFGAASAGLEETLLLVGEDEVAVLRDLLTHDWARVDTGETVPRADIRLEAGPVLVAGASRFPLFQGRPVQAGDEIVLPGETPVTLRRVPGSARAVREVPFETRDPALIPDVAGEAAFRATCPARLTLTAPPEIGRPPILLDRADRDFVYRRGWRGWAPVSGRVQLNSQVLRARDMFVLLERHVEGMILDEAGVATEYGYVGAFDGTQPPHFGREGDRYFLDTALLDAAPRLDGRFAVFYGGVYQNYYHWLIDAMVPLSLMAPLLPDDVTLLLPGSLAQFREHPIGKLDYLEVLEAFGFGGLNRIEVPGQICRVEEVYWPDRCNMHQVPASAVRTARERVLARLPATGGERARIYVKRAGSRAVANEEAIEALMQRNGFTVYAMEDLTASAQIALFRNAELVVAGHGAAMANLMFCPEGTQVVELSPACEYRPFFNELCGKLGLGHAVLPCPTDHGGFFGQMTVDRKRLARLLNMVSARLAA